MTDVATKLFVSLVDFFKPVNQQRNYLTLQFRFFFFDVMPGTEKKKEEEIPPERLTTLAWGRWLSF